MGFEQEPKEELPEAYIGAGYASVPEEGTEVVDGYVVRNLPPLEKEGWDQIEVSGRGHRVLIEVGPESQIKTIIESRRIPDDATNEPEAIESLKATALEVILERRRKKE